MNGDSAGRPPPVRPATATARWRRRRGGAGRLERRCRARCRPDTTSTCRPGRSALPVADPLAPATGWTSSTVARRRSAAGRRATARCRPAAGRRSAGRAARAGDLVRGQVADEPAWRAGRRAAATARPRRRWPLGRAAGAAPCPRCARPRALRSQRRELVAGCRAAASRSAPRPRPGAPGRRPARPGRRRGRRCARPGRRRTSAGQEVRHGSSTSTSPANRARRGAPRRRCRPPAIDAEPVGPPGEPPMAEAVAVALGDRHQAGPGGRAPVARRCSRQRGPSTYSVRASACP